ncbi:MAG: MFS transporter [Actinomycetota bacterium]|nr:MFS transporter [Actinomycetota bacterium]
MTVAAQRDRRPLLALLAANTVSITGNSMTFLAVPWFVLQTTGSPTRTGITAFCEGVAFVLSSLFGGLAVDRLGRRRVSVASDLVSGAAIASIPLAHLTVGLPFPLLLVLVSIAALVRAPGDTAREVLVPALVRRAATSLERATSAYDGVSRGARMLGAPLAGVLIALVGSANVLFVDAGTFLISALLVRLLVPDAPAENAGGAGSERRQWLADLREGVAYLGRDRLLAATVVMVMVTNMLDAAYGSVLAPVFAKHVLGSAIGLGLMSGVFGGGALLGTLGYGVIGPRLPRRAIFAGAFLLAGAPRFVALAAEPGLPVILVVMFVAGVACGAINPILGAVLYERIPEPLQGRVFGVVTAGSFAAIPFGALGAGYLIGLFGLRSSLLLVGTAYLVVTLSPLVFPSWREMDA